MQRSTNFLSNALSKTALVLLALNLGLPSFALEATLHRDPKKPINNNPTETLAVSGSSRSEHNADAGAYPNGPELSVTPGVLCSRATELRYSEKIKYCERNVDSALKNEIIRDYDRTFSYSVQNMPRTDFKIDHLIPLCAGGSNERGNLWPQHKTVYTRTDRIEETVCRLMSAGKLKQDEAVDIVLDVKMNLETSEEVLIQLLARL